MISRAKAKYIKSLQLKKYRQQQEVFLVEGEKNILELLASPLQVIELYITADFAEKLNQIHPKIQGAIVPQREIEKIGTLKSNSAGLAIAEKPVIDTDLLYANGKNLVLDAINDPGNLGTIIRIADWYGISNIICSSDTTDNYNPKVIQASKGSFSRVQVVYMDLVQFLSKSRLPVFGMVLDGKNIHDVSFPEYFNVIIGSESHGISQLLEDLITERITIPRIGKAESLNAAIATALVCDRAIFG